METEYNLSERARWTLRLLYTPDDNGNIQPLYGRTRLVKAMFLVQRKMEEEFGIDVGFEFKAYKYGPFDDGVYEAVETLQSNNLVKKTPPHEHDSLKDQPKYEVTVKGAELGQNLWENLDPGQKKLLRWVRYKQASRPIGSLLSYVYRTYPDMTTESEISKRYS